MKKIKRGCRTMELFKNKIYRCQISGYSSDGSGVAKIDGRTVFVPHTAVGDQCGVKIVKVGKKVSFGRLETLYVPSKHRITPVCPVSDKCGGCCYQHITYEEELRAKEQKVRDALTRIGGQDGDKLLGITGAPSELRYRNKAQYPVGTDSFGNVVRGFYRLHSHTIVPSEQCLIQSEKADRIADIVLAWMREFNVVPYDYTTRRGAIRHIYVRVGEKSRESQLTLISATDKLPETGTLIERLRESEPSVTGILINHNQRGDNVILGDHTDVLWGDRLMEDRLCGNSFLISPEAFYQVNHAQAERLYECAAEFAGLSGNETVLELYCGAGTITLFLAQFARRVIGVEIVPEAIENARLNMERNGITNVEFICADAGLAARKVSSDEVDVLVVDPPRKGLNDNARNAIFKLQPDKIVYISCDPATLARDVKELCGAGYSMQKTQAFDMFPRTSHVETVVQLSLREHIHKIEIPMQVDSESRYKPKEKATYPNIKAYVKEKYGFGVTALYIAQVKEKCGLEKRPNYNISKNPDAKVPQCPPEKEAAIIDALRHFGEIE